MFKRLPFCQYEYSPNFFNLADSHCAYVRDAHARRMRNMLWLAVYQYWDNICISWEDSFFLPESVQYHVG